MNKMVSLRLFFFKAIKKAGYFLKSQGEQVKQGGFPILLRKIRLLLSKIVLFLPAFFAVLASLILRPFIIIRLRGLDISRIGGVYGADFYLSELFLGMHSKRNFDIFYFTADNKIICNRQWVKMWRRVLRVYPIAKIAVIMDVIQRGLLKDTSHIIPMTTINEMHGESFKSESIKLRPVLECKKLHLFFTKEEEVRGQRALEDLGIPQGSPFVCFHSRDSAYLNILYPDRDWSYHDYRDSSIFNYLASVEELVRRGYYAIRMGAVVKEKLKTTNPAIIDYAINGNRTDFLDIYLGAKCRFFICSDTGLSIIPEVFRRPTVYTNWTDIKRISPWVLNGLFIIKKFYSNKEKRFFKFKELLGFQFGESETKNFFSENGIELVENNQEEIMDVVDEMETRLRGDWKAGEEDEELQRRFWAIFGPYKLKSPDLLIGAKFLRQNRQLLD